jgi:hypothetical protein
MYMPQGVIQNKNGDGLILAQNKRKRGAFHCTHLCLVHTVSAIYVYVLKPPTDSVYSHITLSILNVL